MTLQTIFLQQAQGGGMSMIVMMVALFAIMYFFMIRPQQKKQKELRNFQNALKEGDKVVTLSTTEHAENEINGEVEDDGSATEGAGDTSEDSADDEVVLDDELIETTENNSEE